MFIDIPTIVVAALVIIVAWQQYNIAVLQDEVDETIDKHNDLVAAINAAFGELTEAIRKQAND